MKSYKQFKQELNEKVTASLSVGPSVSDADFSSIRGLGINSGDVITANLPGDKGDRATGKGKDKVRDDVIATIEAGKKNGFIEEDETGKLSYRGTDGKLHNSPYAALEASTSFTKNVLVSSGVDNDLATKGSEAFSSLLKSGYISYDHKKGKVYVGDDEIDSFDSGSEKSMNDITKTLPLKIFRNTFKSYLSPLQIEVKKATTRGKRKASKAFKTAVTNINSLMKRIDGLSEDDVKTLMPFFVGDMINTQEMMNQSSDPPVEILPKRRRPVGDPIDPPGPGGPPKKLDPKYFYPNGTPKMRPADGYGGGRNPQFGKPWATPETDRMRPQLRRGPDGPYWYTPPTPPVASQSSTTVKNFIKEVENTLVSIKIAKVVDRTDTGTNKTPSDQQSSQQQQGGPSEIPRGRWWKDGARGWRKPGTPWWMPPDYIGERPEFEGDVPEIIPPSMSPKGRSLETLQRWFDEYGPDVDPPPHIIDDWTGNDDPARKPKRGKNGRWFYPPDAWRNRPPGFGFGPGRWWRPALGGSYDRTDTGTNKTPSDQQSSQQQQQGNPPEKLPPGEGPTPETPTLGPDESWEDHPEFTEDWIERYRQFIERLQRLYRGHGIDWDEILKRYRGKYLKWKFHPLYGNDDFYQDLIENDALREFLEWLRQYGPDLSLPPRDISPIPEVPEDPPKGVDPDVWEKLRPFLVSPTLMPPPLDNPNYIKELWRLITDDDVRERFPLPPLP